MESTSIIQPLGAQDRNWLELPADVMFMILLKLGAIEILAIAQNVCSSWRKICKDPLMWRVIDIHNAGDLYGMDHVLEIMCKHAVDRSCGQLVDINIEYFGTDELLQHISESSKHLRRLRIAFCNDISDKRLSEAVSNLPLLEDFEIWTLCSYFVETLKAVGQCCPLLKMLKLNREFPGGGIFCNVEAFAIAETMPKLHHLQLLCNDLSNTGLQAVLDGCPDLESLDLRHCFNLDLATGGPLKEQCTERIKILHLPNPRIKIDYNREIYSDDEYYHPDVYDMSDDNSDLFEHEGW